MTKEFIEQARQTKIGIVLADSQKYPLLADLTSDFVYLRLQDAKAEIETGYGLTDLQNWAMLARSWEKGEEPEQFSLFAPSGSPR